MALDALTHINESIQSKEPLTASHVKWVITVPAIWDDAAKQIMRTAAEKAELPPCMLPFPHPYSFSIYNIATSSFCPF